MSPRLLLNLNIPRSVGHTQAAVNPIGSPLIGERREFPIRSLDSFFRIDDSKASIAVVLKSAFCSGPEEKLTKIAVATDQLIPREHTTYSNHKELPERRVAEPVHAQGTVVAQPRTAKTRSLYNLPELSKRHPCQLHVPVSGRIVRSKSRPHLDHGPFREEDLNPWKPAEECHVTSPRSVPRRTKGDEYLTVWIER